MTPMRSVRWKYRTLRNGWWCSMARCWTLRWPDRLFHPTAFPGQPRLEGEIFILRRIQFREHLVLGQTGHRTQLRGTATTGSGRRPVKYASVHSTILFVLRPHPRVQRRESTSLKRTDIPAEQRLHREILRDAPNEEDFTSPLFPSPRYPSLYTATFPDLVRSSCHNRRVGIAIPGKPHR